jgi:serpin B
MPFEQTYLDMLGMHYGAGLGAVDFNHNPEEARQEISRWIEHQTEGHITDMPPSGSVTPATRLVLANAIYFRGEWTYPFTGGTQDSAFHLTDGQQVTVPMMRNNFAWMQCGRGSNYYGVELNYGESRNAAILILLPDAGRFRDFEAGLDQQLFQDILTGLRATNMFTFRMPRFDFESDIDLQAALSAMGMTVPFGSGADFTGVSPNGGLFIDYAGHKATISVDENGTEASGVSLLGMATSGAISECGREVTADRPFIFAIYDRETSAILFLGRVMNPSL